MTDIEVKHALCEKCKAIKPLADFKKYLTLTESKARGYVGQVRVQVESRFCKACRPKKKPISKLTSKELQNKAVSGDLSPTVVAHRKAAIYVKAHAAQVAGGHKGQHAKRLNEWSGVLDAMQIELNKVRQQEKYCLMHGPAEMAMFFRAYIGVVSAQRANTKMQAMIGTQRAPEGVWQQLVTPERVSELREMWEDQPIEQRINRRIPVLLNRAITNEGAAS